MRSRAEARPTALPAGSWSSPAGSPPITGLKRSMSTRNESWPCSEGRRANSTSRPPAARPVRQLLLLLDREQQIGLHADDQRALDREALAARPHRAAVVGEIEQIHRARDVQIAVRIELPGELGRVILQIRLDFEVDAERIAGLALGVGALAAEALRPFLRRAIRDHAELAREAHALHRNRIGAVVAFVPGRIAADHFPLQRAQRDRERRRARRRRNRHDAARFVREQRAVREHGHAAERRPDHGGELLDAERDGDFMSGARDVLDGEHRERQSIRLAGRGIDRRPARSSRTGCRAS